MTATTQPLFGSTAAALRCCQQQENCIARQYISTTASAALNTALAALQQLCLDGPTTLAAPILDAASRCSDAQGTVATYLSDLESCRSNLTAGNVLGTLETTSGLACELEAEVSTLLKAVNAAQSAAATLAAKHLGPAISDFDASATHYAATLNSEETTQTKTIKTNQDQIQDNMQAIFTLLKNIESLIGTTVKIGSQIGKLYSDGIPVELPEATFQIGLIIVEFIQEVEEIIEVAEDIKKIKKLSEQNNTLATETKQLYTDISNEEAMASALKAMQAVAQNLKGELAGLQSALGDLSSSLGGLQTQLKTAQQRLSPETSMTQLTEDLTALIGTTQQLNSFCLSASSVSALPWSTKPG